MNGSVEAKEGSRSMVSPMTQHKHQPDKTTLLALALIYRLSDMLLLVERCSHSTPVVWSKCTKPKAMGKSMPDIHHIHPTGKVSKCRNIFP